MFHVSPLKFLFICLFISIPVFSFIIRVSEYPLSYLVERNGFHKYANCFWWTVVTMTTIGYGDYFPRTPLGRIVTFLLSIWGVIIVSSMVVVLSNYVTPSNVERKAFFMIKKLGIMSRLRENISHILLHLAKGSRIFRKNKAVDYQVVRQVKLYRGYFKKFRELQDDEKAFHFSEPIREVVITQNDVMRKKLTTIRNN